MISSFTELTLVAIVLPVPFARISLSVASFGRFLWIFRSTTNVRSSTLNVSLSVSLFVPYWSMSSSRGLALGLIVRANSEKSMASSMVDLPLSFWPR